MEVEEAIVRAREAVDGHAGLRLLVLHGSRALAEDHALSDWDFAYLADGDDDHFPLLDDLASALGTDAIDLVDLSSASAFLRYRAARDGIPVFERTPGAFVDFAVAASLFWCDIETVVRRAHADMLAELA